MDFHASSVPVGSLLEPGGFVVAYSCSNSSHRAKRCCKSWLGLLLFRAGAGVLGVQVTPAYDGNNVSLLHTCSLQLHCLESLTLIQFEHGLFLSHLILRCWHRTHALCP